MNDSMKVTLAYNSSNDFKNIGTKMKSNYTFSIA